MKCSYPPGARAHSHLLESPVKNFLVAIDDPLLRDQLRMAFKMLPTTRALGTRRAGLPLALETPHRVEGVVEEDQRDRLGAAAPLRGFHQAPPPVPILALAPGADKQLLSKAKIQGEITAVLPLPLDPHDLLSRLLRFVERRNVM